MYVIQGFTGQLDNWLGRTVFEPTFIERLDAMFAAGECPHAVIVLVDAWTSRGGSQFLNSSSTGRYQDYLCDEVVPFIDARYPTLAAPEHRGISGKSSGGYGAMVVPMLRPDVFGALASHAGDALFECCYLPEFPAVARQLRDDFDGSFEVFRERLAESRTSTSVASVRRSSSTATRARTRPIRTARARRCCRSSSTTGRLNEPSGRSGSPSIRCGWPPHHADALRGLRRIYLDAGRSDEWFLDLGAQAFAGRARQARGRRTPWSCSKVDTAASPTATLAPIRELVLALGHDWEARR